MIFAFTECIGLILAPILTRCKTLRAAVMLQNWQLDPEIMETDGGQALASQSPTSHLRKIVSLHHFLMQRSFIWWIGFIPDCPLNLLQNFSLSLIMLFWLWISEFQIWMVSVWNQNYIGSMGRWTRTFPLTLPLLIKTDGSNHLYTSSFPAKMFSRRKVLLTHSKSLVFITKV